MTTAINPPENNSNKPTRATTNTSATVLAAYAPLVAAGSVTQDDANLIAWLVTMSRAKGLNNRAIADMLGISEATVSRLFTASYPAGIGAMIDKVRDFHAVQSAINSDEDRFVELSITKRIWEACSTAQNYGMLMPIYGPSQLSKTHSTKEFALRHPGSVYWMSMPVTGAWGLFIHRLNQTLGLSAGASATTLYNEPFRVLKPGDLLIVDEYTQAFLHTGRSGPRFKTIEYIRILNDETGAGIILPATNGVREEMERGRYRQTLGQTVRRSLGELQLPDVLPRDDMDLMASAWGYPAASDEIHKIRTDLMLSRGGKAYKTRLRAGLNLATNRNERPSWRHWLMSHNAIAKLGIA